MIRRKRQRNPSGGQASGWTRRTRVQIFRVYLFKTAWTFRLQCGKVCNSRTVAFNHLVSVQDKLRAINMIRYWPYAVRSSNICAKSFVGVPQSTCNRRVRKKIVKKMLFSLRKRLTIIDLFEGLWSVGTRFRHQRQSQVLNRKQLATLPYSTVHGGQFDTKYVTFEQTMQAAFAGEITSVV